MNTINKIFKLNIYNTYLSSKGLNAYIFFKSNSIRTQIITSLLEENISFKSFEILNIIYLNDTFIIELKLELFCTSIIKFDTLQNALSFCLYIQKNESSTQTISLYLLNNIFYLIIDNTETYNIKFSDFDCIKYSPLIHSKIVENGFKLSV